jgi:hypothetical protein
MWLRHGFGLLVAGILVGCATVDGAPSPDTVSLFQADAADTVILEAVHREQEALMSTCSERQSCDQIHFTRAMVALFQNREAAAASFQQAIAVAPNGPFSDSSALWIRFLADRTFPPASADKSHQAFLEVMKGTVRAWLRRQHRAVETIQSSNSAVDTLQRQIRVRDKRIAELTDQLHALKQIDLESHGKLNLQRSLSK